MNVVEKQKATITGNRIRWIDCAKSIAMFLVVLEHTYTTVFTNAYILNATYSCVCLFVLLSGVSAWVSHEKRNVTLEFEIKRIVKMLGYYAFASLCVYVISNRRFDLLDFLYHLVMFDIAMPYYYFVFFFQLILITPLLIRIIERINERKDKILFHIIVVIILTLFAYILEKYTIILPVHGGGKYLFGATYLILYYCGIAFMSLGFFKMNTIGMIITLLISGIFCVIYCWLFTNALKPLDSHLIYVFPSQINPPAGDLCLYSIGCMFFLFSSFSLLEKSKLVFVPKLLSCIAFFGKYTLTTYLWHGVIQIYLFKLIGSLESGLLKNFVFLFFMSVLPAVCHYYIKKYKLWKKITKSFTSTN